MPFTKPLDALAIAIKNELALFDWDAYIFGHKSEAIIAALVFTAAVLFALILKFSRRKIPGRSAVVFPAFLPGSKKSFRRFIVGIPLCFVLAGIPFFLIALADPRAGFTKEIKSAKGRRIAILIDSSGSTEQEFKWSEKLKRSGRQTGFYTEVGAAERFIRVRMRGNYNDSIALIQFGNESYVIVPFTNDYDTILTSISLISDPAEQAKFPDTGTKISQSINQAVELFKTFGFLDVAGNAMVLFSDGMDMDYLFEQKTLEEILANAVEGNIPLYFIRIQGGISHYDSDADWAKVVKKTGGEFFVGADDESILRAIEAIDRGAVGEIENRRYGVKEPRFAIFLLMALGLWAMALILYLFSRKFRKFP